MALPIDAEQAQAVAGVLALCDGGCEQCTSELATEMKEQFPEHDWEDLVQKAKAAPLDVIE